MEYTLVIFSKVKYWSSSTIHFSRSFTGICLMSGKNETWYDDGSSVGQSYHHLTTIGGEIQIFDADGYIFHLTHGFVLQLLLFYVD